MLSNRGLDFGKNLNSLLLCGYIERSQVPLLKFRDRSDSQITARVFPCRSLEKWSNQTTLAATIFLLHAR